MTRVPQDRRIALTPQGRVLYDELVIDVDHRHGGPGRSRADVVELALKRLL